MEKITYLFGAGASANALPVVKYFNFRFDRLKKEIGQVNSKGMPLANIAEAPALKEIYERYEQILKDLRIMHSIDTLAKSYFIKYGQHSEQYQFLKTLIAFYFLWEQSLHRKFKTPPFKNELIEYPSHGNLNLVEREKRYTQLIAHYIDTESKKIPSNIRFISWNYDSQLQLAFKEFQDDKYSISYHCENTFNSYPHKYRAQTEVNPEDIQSVQLNGFASSGLNVVEGGFKKELDRIDYSQMNNTNLLIELIKEFKLTKTLSNIGKVENESTIRFSWEEDKMTKEALDIAMHIAGETELLVVVGYSFPAYNRKVDQTILDWATRNKRLRKIVINDPGLDLDFFSNSFGLSKKNEYKGDYKIEKWDNTEEFPLF